MGALAPMQILIAAALLPLISLIAAALLWRLGVRGRRIDDHALCGRCGYDLFGMPDGSASCPECGADVTAPGATRTGHRERRRGLLWAALSLALLGGAGAAVVGRFAYTALGAVENQPTWWLARRLDVRPGSGPMPGFDELSRRLGHGELSTAHVRRVADRILAWQADRSISWNAAWGNFVETARLKHLIGDEPWARYARQGVAFYTQTRSILRRGEELPYMIGVSNCRFGDARPFSVRYSSTFRLAGRPVGSSTGGRFDRLGPREGSGGGGRMTIPEQTLQATADGAHTLDADSDLELYERPATPDIDPPLVAWRESQPRPLRITPADAETVETANTPELQKQVEGALSVRRLEYDPEHRRMRIELAHQTLTIDVAADVTVRATAQEWPIDSVSMNARSAGAHEISGKADAANVSRADVILRSSTAVARKTIEMTRIWGGELVLKDVPITRLDDQRRRILRTTTGPATRPAP